ncbi:MAG TPA: MBL fold metallo-hydrolase [Clostridiaceae bacterium]|nr:MBL fold metallo-hydrolase [Clostridiaceae bacterium]
MEGYFKKEIVKLTHHCFVLTEGINTGILVKNRKALLFDCCDILDEEDLKKLGVDHVERILFTQHRRTLSAGAYQFAGKGTRLTVPREERHLFDSVETYWEDEKSRWHIYHHQPGMLVLPKSLPVSDTAGEGDAIEWEGFCIKVYDTPGATDGSVSYVFKDGGKTICFSGDAVYGNGQVLDLYSLQKGFGTTDYHGFIGNMKKLVLSLMKLQKLNADVLVPSHGEIVYNPSDAITKCIEQMNELLENYRSISSINFYFPDYFSGNKTGFEKMKKAESAKLPYFIKEICFTSFIILSDCGAALLVDCGQTQVVDILKSLVADGTVKSVDGCWVTHYHDDHVDAIRELVSAFACPVLAIDLVAEIIKNPANYFLPCISPVAVPEAEPVPDGFSWNWNEFKLTAFHFPGQTFYHGGLLAEGHGMKLFFAGDSFSPDGIDDYCCGNRNFIGDDRGFLKCVSILRRCKPDYIINQHQQLMFKFTDMHLDYIEQKLMERIDILKKVLPWNNPNFGTDEWWARTFPYEQAATTGSHIIIEVHFTNHENVPVRAFVQPVAPEGWNLENECDIKEIIVPPVTSGTTDTSYTNPDGRLAFRFKVPENAARNKYIIPFRISWDGKYLGQFRHAIVDVQELEA